MRNVAPEKLRRPRAQVIINGKVAIPTNGSVKRNGNFQADTFDLTFPLYHDPDHPFEWWMTQDEIEIDFQVGLADAQGSVSEWISTVNGLVDELDADFLAGTITINGRDRTSLLIDEKTFRAYPNKTASEIVNELAAKHGLTTDVQTTKTRVGTFYKEDHNLVANGQFGRGRTEWDLVTYLAQQEGFDAWITGKTLHFRAVDDQQGVGVREINFAPPTMRGKLAVASDASVINLKLKHNLHLAKDIKVEVRSWNPSLGKKVKATSSLVKKKTAGSSKDEGSVYVFTYPKLDAAQAQEKANALYKQMTKEEYCLSWDEPGDFSLTPRHRVRLKSADGVLNQTYFVNEIDLSFGSSGIRMSVTAKNHPEVRQVS